MRVEKPKLSCTVSFILALASFAASVAHGQALGTSEAILWSFGNGTDGANPEGALIRDARGNLYGTTQCGGGAGPCYGTVFELTSAGKEFVLWSLVGSSSSGPEAGLLRDRHGHLYGTTPWGGAGGRGTIFELRRRGVKWVEFVLWSFADSSEFGSNTDGEVPEAGLLRDAKGNLYGTTIFGGDSPHSSYDFGRGTIFKLTPDGHESVVWNFGDTAVDGKYPATGLIMDKDGNLYGTTQYGGPYPGFTGLGFGTVFKVSPDGMETVLWNFADGSDGAEPQGGLLLDSSGNLYGTASAGGIKGGGTVFKLTPDGSESTLWSFGDGTVYDASRPEAGVIMDRRGNLYGTTFYGGLNDQGTVFELTPPSINGGNWTESVLWSFGKIGGPDGYWPTAGVTIDARGNLYGTTPYGGAYGQGIVFEIERGRLTYHPRSLSFTSRSHNGAPSASKTLSIANRSSVVSMNFNPSISGSPFAITADTCVSPLPPESSCQISVDFAPIVIGKEAGSLFLSGTAAGSPQTVELKGTAD